MLRPGRLKAVLQTLPLVECGPILRRCIFTRRLKPRLPEKALQIATTAGVKPHAFALQHSLLFVRRQHDASRRTFALRIDHTMPWRVSFIGSVHGEANRAGRVAFAEHVSDLAVGHHVAPRNPADDLVNAFAIKWIWFTFG